MGKPEVEHLIERLRIWPAKHNGEPGDALSSEFVGQLTGRAADVLTLLLADRERLRSALEPFAELTQPSFDDEAPPRRGDVHLMIMGDGELGDLPLSAFWNAAAALNTQGER